jgi:hypothetical protein
VRARGFSPFSRVVITGRKEASACQSVAPINYEARGSVKGFRPRAERSRIEFAPWRRRVAGRQSHVPVAELIKSSLGCSVLIAGRALIRGVGVFLISFPFARLLITNANAGRKTKRARRVSLHRPERDGWRGKPEAPAHTGAMQVPTKEPTKS